MNKYKKYRSYAKWFDSEELHRNLRDKSIKGGISTTGSQAIRFGLSLVSTYILARILIPADFGLIGMVVAFTGFASIIQDMGLSMAVIQKERISHQQVTNLFWINVMICSALALIFGLLSPFIVAFYHNDHRLYPIIWSYAIGIAISGLSIQHSALMTRRMLFTTLAKCNIGATLLSVVCGVASALWGWGYWAIVILNISSIFFNTILLWIICDWRPSLPKRRQSITEFVHFGAAISGFNIVNYFSKNSDNIIIGKYVGPTAVGFYTKAYGLLMLPITHLKTPLTTVALPAMSKLQNDPIQYINYYKKYVFVVAFFSMPLIAILGIFAKEIIYVILGSQWLPSSAIFQVLAIASFIEPVSSSSGLVMVSSGKTKKYFLTGCVSSVLFIAGFFISAKWGVMGITASFAITTYILLLPTLIYSFRNTPIKLSMFFGEILLPMLHSFALVVVLLLTNRIFSLFVSSIPAAIFSSILGISFYYFSWKIYPQGRNKFDNIKILLDFITKKLGLRNMTI